MPPKLLIPAVFVLGIVIASGAVVALSGGGDDGDGDTALGSPTVPGTIVATFAPTPPPSATPTLETAPETTPTPELSPEEQARNLTLVEAPAGMLQFTADGPYVVPGDALGVFYLDIETQQIEGWYDLLTGTMPSAFSGDNRFTLFHRRDQVFRGGVTYPAGLYLGDRATRKVYRWEGDAEPVYQKSENGGFEITSRGDLVLFRVPVEGGDDWFALLNVTTGDVESLFQAHADIALLSTDGERIAFATWRDTGTDWAIEVWAMDIADGDEIFRAPLDFDELDLEGTVELIESWDGETFTFVANPVKARFAGVASRFSWDGDRQTEVTGRRVFMSPYGDYTAVMEPLIPSDADESMPWNVYSAIDMRDGAATFRVTGATRSLGRSNGNRWLADGSGLLVAAPPSKIVLAMQDGELIADPGIPSPDSPDRFMRPIESGVGVFDASGTQLVHVNFQGGINDSTDPWGNTGREVRIVLLRPGRGGPGLTASITGLHVEQAPYTNEPLLQINEVGVALELLDLYNDPGGALVTGRVASPYRVAIEEIRSLCHGAANTHPERCPASDSTTPYEIMAPVFAMQGASLEHPQPAVSTWARVTTPDGQTGWLLIQVSRQGI